VTERAQRAQVSIVVLTLAAQYPGHMVLGLWVNAAGGIGTVPAFRGAGYSVTRSAAGNGTNHVSCGATHLAPRLGEASSGRAPADRR
jgi:hypothetical protein